jgi:asparagine synthase (glutamine-hydrolysing)
MLSGGIDSSSIVGALHAQRGDRPEPLQTFSIVGPGEPWDETPFVDAVAAMWPIASHRRPASEGSCEYYAAEAAKYQDLPPYPNGVMANGIFEAARSLYGIRVLLTGLWSDEWLGPSGMYAPDLLRSGRFVQLWRHYRAGDTHHQTPASLFRSLVWPLVPPGARQAVKRTLRRDGISPWITPSHAAAVNLADRVGPPPADVRFPTLAKTQSWSSALGGSSMHGIEAESRATSGFGLETRHPFADREIVQFGLAIPEEQRWRGRQRKVALRHAARDWVPAQVHDRPPPVGAASILVRAIERHVSAGLWHNAATGRRGWVDPALLRAAYERMMARYRASDGGYEDSVRPLWMACAAEIFTRRVLDEETQGCSLGGPARS